MPRSCSRLCRKPKQLFFKITLNRNSPTWYIRDTCGQICAVITWLLISYGLFAVFYIIIPPWVNAESNLEKSALSGSDKLQNQLLNKLSRSEEERKSSSSFLNFSSTFYAYLNSIIFLFLSSMAFISHCRAMFTDPGATEVNNASPDSIAKMNLPAGHVLYKCTKCAAIKPERAHHCSVCRRCINKMDHHCPWVNNCVGEKNQKYFVLFTLYICLMSGHALCLVVHRFLVCANLHNGWTNDICTLKSPGTTLMNLIGLTFEAALFCLFTAIMFGTQVYGICVDETGIEQLKGDMSHKKGRRKNSKFLNFKSVFGDKFSYKWLLPFFAPKWAKNDISLYAV